jgi:hypothetical protein
MTPQIASEGFYNGSRQQESMRLSLTEKLVFIGAFVNLMHWGVKVTESVLNYALS